MNQIFMYHIRQTSKKLLADTHTPVSIYLRLRDKYPNTFLLESSDYHGQENSMSFICCQPMASMTLRGREFSSEFPDNSVENHSLGDAGKLTELMSAFMGKFDIKEEAGVKFSVAGLFGYLAYDAVQRFEDIKFDSFKKDQFHIPDMHYSLFRYVIAIDHFKNDLFIVENQIDGQASNIDEMVSLITSRNVPTFHFSIKNGEESNFTDAEFLEIVKKGIHHCQVGDVFQIVLSRRFQSSFEGDEFQVYRALRSINPSPYLFYFDYGNFKIFGSSPEAQIVIKNGEATIYPIAGTFRRTGNDQSDAELAKKLYEDPKEDSEHVMLVDLARNDLSKSSDAVKVETYKEIQYYSHVIHLVSKVSGKLKKGTSPLEMVGSTFPAGTLSGAPKHMAMQLIDKYEAVKRGYYGGAIGYLGLNGDFNHAIMIRSFLSQDNTLFYQAGAGIVAKSTPESEVQEVYNKLAALKSALELAQQI
tara:strand:+ start:65722 stop:67140 length:1419 start_codon:yes stop_codon:yes gene_type:complete